ncbi:hypothetical protein SAMN05414139_06981 [Burkholderia sp. D7]|nr:hypothetical protein SAMN05414139_06981 [Burkholderia sp. D7]
MATNRKPLSIVLTYSAETEAINIQSVSTSEIASTTANALTYPVFFEEHGHALDDEFARRLGAGLLAMLAVSHPEIRPLITTTVSPLPD